LTKMVSLSLARARTHTYTHTHIHTHTYTGVRQLQFDDLHAGQAVEFSEEQIVYILHQVA
jgi:hypothetical protein